MKKYKFILIALVFVSLYALRMFVISGGSGATDAMTLI